MNSEKLKGHILILITNILFAINMPVSKYLLPTHVPPEGLTIMRMGFACIMFWLVSLFLKQERVTLKDLGLLFFCAICGVGFNQGLFIVGLNRTSPVDASIIATAVPIFVMLLAAVILKEPITHKKAFGVLLGASGGLLLVFSSAHLSTGSSSLDGDLMIIVSGMMYAIYLVVSKPLTLRYSSVTIMKWMFLFTTISLLPFTYSYVLDAPVFHQTEWNVKALSAVFYVLFGATFIPYLLIPMSLKRIRPTTVSMYNYIQPIVASFIAVLIGQEDFKGLRFVVKKSMTALLFVITGLVLYVELFPGTIVNIFGLTGETATNTLRIVALCYLPSVITYLTMTVYQLTQRHKLAITIAIIQPLMVIPTMYLFTHIDVNLIWVSFVISELIVLAIILSLSERVHRSDKSLSRWMLLPAAASDETSIDISMECTEEDLSRFMPELDAFLASFEVSQATRNRVELCCEELLLNMINHSGPDGKIRRADLMLRVSDSDINICIRDNGRPFDPVNYSEKVGAGLLIVRGVCQKLEYKYQFNQNTVFIKIDKN